MSEVAGTVIDGAGNPYPGALVRFSARRNDSLVESDSARTRQDGAFVFVIDGGLDGLMVSLSAESRKAASKLDLSVNGRGSSHATVRFTLPDSSSGPVPATAQ